MKLVFTPGARIEFGDNSLSSSKPPTADIHLAMRAIVITVSTRRTRLSCTESISRRVSRTCLRVWHSQRRNRGCVRQPRELAPATQPPPQISIVGVGGPKAATRLEVTNQNFETHLVSRGNTKGNVCSFDRRSRSPSRSDSGNALKMGDEKVKSSGGPIRGNTIIQRNVIDRIVM